MKHLLNYVTLMLLGVVLVFTSCKKEDNPEPEQQSELKTGEVTLRKTEYGNDWVYFSFPAEDTVTISNHNTSLNWDIAFNRYDNVRTNSGKSGSGKGGTYDAGEIDFNSITLANENGYAVDDSIQIVKEIGARGPIYMNSAGNKTFKGCILFSMADYSYTPNNHAYVVKTADGKYARLLVTDFYNDRGESGYMTFKYAYQPDGSRKLD